MADISTLTDALCQSIFLEVEASGRHVHLSSGDAKTLFGGDLTQKRPLSQPGQFVAQERVTLVGPKGSLSNVAVLGPCRGASQVEISRTDGIFLGIDAPVRLSGELASTPAVILEGSCGKLNLSQGVIVAKRHLHLTPESAAYHEVSQGDLVKVKCLSQRPLILEEVAVRISAQFATRLHIDFDEANACGHCKGDLGMIVHG